MTTVPSLSANGLKTRLIACPLRIRKWACAAHMAVIAVLTLAPAWLFPPSPPGVPGIDKAVHVGLYGVLGALLRWMAGPWRGRYAVLWLPVAGVAYGFLLEGLQPWIGGAGRAFSWGDAAANLVGVALGWLAVQRLSARRVQCDASHIVYSIGRAKGVDSIN